LPAAAAETATPRRRTNQCDMSAISGPNIAEDPAPISTAWTSANCSIELESAASRNPAPSATEAISAGIQ
jgi:hypothetical protein